MNSSGDKVITLQRPVVIRPPDTPAVSPKPFTIFLGGPTSSNTSPDWRTRLCTGLADLPVTFLDPKNPAWDSTWREDRTDARWAAQVDWEMTMREEADLTVFFFEAESDAPVSLLELGLSLAAGNAVLVYTDEQYSKRGNVEVACRRFSADVIIADESTFIATLRQAVIVKLGQQQ